MQNSNITMQLYPVLCQKFSWTFNFHFLNVYLPHIPQLIPHVLMVVRCLVMGFNMACNLSNYQFTSWSHSAQYKTCITRHTCTLARVHEDVWVRKIVWCWSSTSGAQVIHITCLLSLSWPAHDPLCQDLIYETGCFLLLIVIFTRAVL